MIFRKKALLLGTAMFSCMAISAQAAFIKNADLNLTDSAVTVSGMNFAENNGEYATLLVLKPGVSLDSMINAGVEKQEQVKIADGAFEIKFALGEAAEGEYTAYINAGKKTRESRFTYVKDAASVYETVMRVADETEFSKLLEQNTAALNLNDTVYGSISGKENAGKILYREIKAGNIKAENAEALKKAAVKIAMIELFNENKTDGIIDAGIFVEPDILGLDTLDSDLKVTAYSLYCESITESGKAKVIAGLCSNGFGSIRDFEEKFVFEVTKAAIRSNNLSGTGHISSILENNNSVNGFSLTNYKSVKGNAINNKLIGGNYETKSEMQDILNTMVSESGGSGGGSGSAGGKTGNAGAGYTGGTYAPTATIDNGTTKFVFGDITAEYEWAKDAVEALYGKGIIKGRTENEFAPGENITRAEFVKLILGIFGTEISGNSAGFEDVAESDWYADYVNTAFEKGLVKGVTETYFGANENITREDAAVIISRACENTGKIPASVTEPAVFADSADISEYAAEAINALTSADILHGSDGRFYPKNNCTRAEAAVMLKNILDMING